MHNIIKPLPLILSFLLLTGCSGGVKIDIINKSYSSESVCVNAKIPQINGLSSTDLQNAVNEEYITVTNDLLEKFEDEAKTTGNMSEFNMETNVHYNKNGLFSVVTKYDYFARKNHKNTFRITKNIDTKNCVELNFSDLFADDGYIDGINNLLEETVSKSPDKYRDLWARPKITQNQQFFITEDSLVLFYPPYELSYYEQGFVEFYLPLDSVSTYLKSEYRDILLK